MTFYEMTSSDSVVVDQFTTGALNM